MWPFCYSNFQCLEKPWHRKKGFVDTILGGVGIGTGILNVYDIKTQIIPVSRNQWTVSSGISY